MYQRGGAVKVSKSKKWFDPSLLKFGREIRFLIVPRYSGKISSLIDKLFIYRAYHASWRKVKASRKKIKGRGC